MTSIEALAWCARMQCDVHFNHDHVNVTVNYGGRFYDGHGAAGSGVQQFLAAVIECKQQVERAAGGPV